MAVSDACVGKGYGVLKLGVREVDNGVLFELRGGRLDDLRVGGFDGRGSGRDGEELAIFKGLNAEGKGLQC